MSDKAKSRKWQAFKRRVTAMCVRYNMKWTRREMREFIQRLMFASRFEGIDDVDLRVLVRIYNRELPARRSIDAIK